MKFRLQVLMTLGVLSLAFGAQARSWRIELDGSGDFTDIQPAVDAAAAGDTIQIGPGRFDAFHQCIAPAWVEDVIVWVTKDNMTFIGSGQDVTVLGPENFYAPTGRHPKAVCSFGDFSGKFCEMTIENVKTGFMWEQGQLDVQSCVFRAADSRFYALYLFVDRGTISDCRFELPFGGSAIGVLNSLGNVQGLAVSRCMVIGASFGIRVSYGAPNIAISDCMFEVSSMGVVFDQLSTGSMSRCVVTGTHENSLVAANSAAVCIVDSELDGGRIGLYADGGSSISATGVVISNTADAAVSVSSRAQIVVNGSHLLPRSGLSVDCGAASGGSILLDVTGNYWGTTSSTAIEALIHDSQDDASNLYTVQFEPFANGPVPTEPASWRNLKALFR